MDLKFIIVSMTHIYIHEVMRRHYKQQQSCNFSIFRWSSSIFSLSEPANVSHLVKRVGLSLNDSVSIQCCIFEHSECSPFDLSILSGYLSPPTRLLPIARLQLLLDNHKLVLFEISQYHHYQVEFDNNNWFYFNSFAQI